MLLSWQQPTLPIGNVMVSTSGPAPTEDGITTERYRPHDCAAAYRGATAVHGDLEASSVTPARQGAFVEMVVVTDGKLGIVRSIQHFTYTDKDGKAQEATLRVTDVFPRPAAMKSSINVRGRFDPKRMELITGRKPTASRLVPALRMCPIRHAFLRPHIARFDRPFANIARRWT
jgi:hypothetical protein